MYSYTNLRDTVFTEIGIGILANTILLLFHVLLFFVRHKPKTTDLLIGLLALVHLVMLLIQIFINKDIFMSHGGRWSKVTCKLVICVYRSMRSLSMCITCLLNILQAIILCPRSSWLAKYKHTSTLHNLCSLLVLWALHNSIGSYLVLNIIATPNLTSDNFMYVSDSCSLLPMSYFPRYAFFTLLTLREVLMLGVMSLSSGYMVILLYRHKKQSQHLHSTSLSSKASPERRATWTILVLISCFVVISILDDFVSYARHMVKDNLDFYCVQILVIHMYATISPVVFISTEKRMINVSRLLCGGTVNI